MSENNCLDTTSQVITHLEKRPDIENKLVKGLIKILIILSVGVAGGIGVGFYAATYDFIKEKYHAVSNTKNT